MIKLMSCRLPLPLVDVHGRGAATNPAGRFEPLDVELDEPHDSPGRTTFVRDASRSAVNSNDSPDIPFDAAVNPYRGCEHGCPYCYARPFHEYLGLSAGFDFERVILVKTDVASLLRRDLAMPSWRPTTIALSSATDCYQPVERKLGLTRQVLEVLRDFRQPTNVITKNALVRRDLDLIGELAAFGAARLDVTITTLDVGLARDLEPRASSPKDRLAAIAAARAAGVPVGVCVAPVVPGLTDHELPAILSAAAEAGAAWANFTLLRLPGATRDLFLDWLRRRRPERAGRVEARIREVRGGVLNDPRFGDRFRGRGVYADSVRTMFHVTRKRLGLEHCGPRLRVDTFRVPGREKQLDLFGVSSAGRGSARPTAPTG